jgi:hypothetical protein
LWAGLAIAVFHVICAVGSTPAGRAAAGLLLCAVSLAATVSRVALGVLADRRGQDPLRPVAWMLALSIAGYVLLIAGEPVLIAVAALTVSAARRPLPRPQPRP